MPIAMAQTSLGLAEEVRAAAEGAEESPAEKRRRSARRAAEAHKQKAKERREAKMAAEAAAAPALAWGELGDPLREIVAPVYVGLGVECPGPSHWQAFTMAWGRVVDHYFPDWTGSVWLPALGSTVLVALPLIQGVVKLRLDAARARAGTAAPSEKAGAEL